MAINKVVYGSNTLIDLTDTTATVDKVLEGYDFYDAGGVKRTGTATGGGSGSALIVDSIDTAGGTIRTIITDEEVYLQSGVSVEPSTSAITITPSSGYTGFTSVTVGSIVTQSKTATPTTASQTITPDNGAFLSAVKVEPIPGGYIIPAGTLSVNQNGVYDAASYASVDVNVAGGGGGDDLFTATLHRTISGTVSDLTVTSIPSYFFYMCSNLEGAIFPSVSIINDRAFYSCTSLSSISFPLAQSIWSYTFAYCNGLSTVNLPMAKSFYGSAFANCAGLISISASTLVSVGTYAFYNCTRLSTVDFPSVTYIGSCAFDLCERLTTASYSLVTSILARTFERCSSMTTINFPNVSYISTSAFAECYILASVYLPLLQSTSSYVFNHCSLLGSVYFPAATMLGSGTFSNCKSLSVASFPVLTSCSASCFIGCTSLRSLYLLNSVVATGALYMLAQTPMSTSSYLGVFGSIYVKESLLNSWRAAAYWSDYYNRFVGLTDAEIEALDAQQ